MRKIQAGLVAAMLGAMPAAAHASTTELTILLRGQSNAFLMVYFGAMNFVQSEVQSLLGFDGSTHKINLIADCCNGNGLNTINSGTALIGDWLTPVGGDWHNGWTNNTLETGLLADIASKPADVTAAPTAVVWLHNEYDSENPSLTTPEWVSAVRYDALQVRRALHQPAARVPYLFVNAIPWGEGSDASNQAIKVGMANLIADPGFAAGYATQAADMNMTFDAQDFQDDSWYGSDHMDYGDVSQLVDRIARSLADQWASYAQPGSPVATAGGHIASAGPHAVAVSRAVGTASALLVTFAYDTATGLQPFSSGASAGYGWSLHVGAKALTPTSVTPVDGTHLLVQFPAAVPTDRNGVLYYSWGIGRIAQPATQTTPSGFPGRGMAIYDTAGLPFWVKATGLPVPPG